MTDKQGLGLSCGPLVLPEPLRLSFNLFLFIGDKLPLFLYVHIEKRVFKSRHFTEPEWIELQDLY